MSVPAPHFFLFSRSNREDKQGYWSFVLRAADGSATLEAEDCEPHARGERLDLLAVVRGLEALDQPSRVTLVTPSSYVGRGIVFGLDEWGRNGWTWESFGQMVPVKNRDLWQRLDRALQIHRIDGPIRRVDPAPSAPRRHVGTAHKGDRRSRPPTPHRAQPQFAGPAVPVARKHRARRVEPATLASAGRSWSLHRVRSRLRWVLAFCLRRAQRRIERWRLACAQLGTSLLPAPWLD